MVKKMKGIFCFELKKGDATGYWYINVKSGNGSMHRGKQDMKVDCTFKMTDGDCYKLMTGALNAQTAFLQGKIKIVGNMGMAMKLQNLQPKKLKSKM